MKHVTYTSRTTYLSICILNQLNMNLALYSPKRMSAQTVPRLDNQNFHSHQIYLYDSEYFEVLEYDILG